MWLPYMSNLIYLFPNKLNLQVFEKWREWISTLSNNSSKLGFISAITMEAIDYSLRVELKSPIINMQILEPSYSKH